MNTNDSKRKEIALPAQRHEQIVMLCSQRRFISVRDLATAVNASVPTLQRDLEELDRRGFLRRVRGGAMAVAASAIPVPFAEREHQHMEAKQRIGREAAKALDEPGVIFLGSGTTVICMLDHLDASIHRRSQFVTNAYAVARRLAELELTHLLLPGRLIAAVEATVGEHTIAMIEHYTFDQAILGFQGIDPSEGLSDADIAEALLKSRVMARSRRVMGVIDSSKWGTVAPAHVAHLNDLDHLVTDRLSQQARTILKKTGVSWMQATAS